MSDDAMYLLKVNFTIESKRADWDIRSTAEEALNMACTYMEQRGVLPTYRIQEFFDI